MKMTKFTKTILSLGVIFILIAAISLNLTACKDKEINLSSESKTAVSFKEIGSGEKQFYLTVTYLDKSSDKYSIRTDENTVGGALLKENLILGDKSQYGIMIKSVNGVIADYDKDKTYWAFYVDGKYATNGIDTTEIENGCEYALKVEK